MVRILAVIAAVPLLVAAKPVTKPSDTHSVSTLVVYGNDPCPAGAPGEVVVCARQPESERYRIPKAFRGRTYNAARDGSWAGTAKVLEATSREQLPNSCSANGSGGQTGCWDRFVAEANADRQAQAQDQPR